MKTLLACLVGAAALLPVVSGAGEPRPENRREQVSEHREEAERYWETYNGLKTLIAEAAQLQSTYLETGDLAAFRKAGAAWESRASTYLRRRLPPLYSHEFAVVKYRGPDVPAGHDPASQAAYQRIEARKSALMGYTTELRKPD